MPRRKKPAPADTAAGETSSPNKTPYRYFTKPGNTPTGHSSLLPDTPTKAGDTGDESKDTSAEHASPTKDSVAGVVTHSTPLSNKPDLKAPSPFTPRVTNLKRRLSRPEDRKKPRTVADVWRVEEIVAEWTNKNGTLHCLVDWVKSWAPATDSFITPAVVKEWERKKEAGQVSPTYNSRYYAFPAEEATEPGARSNSKVKKKKGKSSSPKTKSKRTGKGKEKKKARSDKRHIPNAEKGDEMEDSDSDDDSDLDSENPSKENSQDVMDDSEEANIYSASPTPPTRTSKKRKLATRTAKDRDTIPSTSSEPGSSPDDNSPGGNKGNTRTVPVLISANDFYGASASTEASPSTGKEKKHKKRKKDVKGRN